MTKKELNNIIEFFKTNGYNVVPAVRLNKIFNCNNFYAVCHPDIEYRSFLIRSDAYVDAYTLQLNENKTEIISGTPSLTIAHISQIEILKEAINEDKLTHESLLKKLKNVHY